jgi:hypothetical protein
VEGSAGRLVEARGEAKEEEEATVGVFW